MDIAYWMHRMRMHRVHRTADMLRGVALRRVGRARARGSRVTNRRARHVGSACIPDGARDGPVENTSHRWIQYSIILSFIRAQYAIIYTVWSCLIEHRLAFQRYVYASRNVKDSRLGYTALSFSRLSRESDLPGYYVLHFPFSSHVFATSHSNFYLYHAIYPFHSSNSCVLFRIFVIIALHLHLNFIYKHYYVVITM